MRRRLRGLLSALFPTGSRHPSNAYSPISNPNPSIVASMRSHLSMSGQTRPLAGPLGGNTPLRRGSGYPSSSSSLLPHALTPSASAASPLAPSLRTLHGSAAAQIMSRRRSMPPTKAVEAAASEGGPADEKVRGRLETPKQTPPLFYACFSMHAHGP
jgi:hypothetical protein